MSTFTDHLADIDRRVQATVSALHAATLATPTEPPPTCGNCDSNPNLSLRECEYCGTSGCQGCMAQCPECNGWVCLEPSRNCSLLNINGSEMCLHCAADHVKQLAEAAKVTLEPRLKQHESAILISAIADLSRVHDEGNSANVLNMAKSNFPEDHGRAYPSAMGSSIALTRWTGQRLTFLAKELGVTL